MKNYIRAQMLNSNRRRAEYDPQNRFRDRTGREHYDNGRFAPTNESAMWAMNLWRAVADDTPAYGEYNPQAHYPMSPYVPPVYEHQTGREEYRPMNRIGFFVGDEGDRSPSMRANSDRDYRSDAEYRRMNEMDRMSGKGLSGGYGRGYSAAPLTREMAEDWTSHMENEDGTHGPHWSLERIQNELEQRGIKCDPIKFWAVINAIYSDDVEVAKKHSVNTMEYYIDRAKAWIDDKDAVPDKAEAYYAYVVQH